MPASAKLVDTHCHLVSADFDDDREDVIERARSAGVEQIIVPGVDLESSRRAIRLAASHPCIYAAVGVHPHHARTLDQEVLRELEGLCASPLVVAIGEIGLDFYRNYSAPADQLQAFENQLNLATDVQLPVIIHMRDSLEEVLSLAVPWAKSTVPTLNRRTGVLHAYSADEEGAWKAIEAGFYIGVAGPLTYPNAHERRKATLHLPMDRLLIETDAPYMSPHPKRGRRNEPGFVAYIAERLAELHGETYASVASCTTDNASHLFGWNHGNSNGNVH
jgi:TatD DNase family protein